jgi:methionine synthase I (cobalamin-dependent)
MKRESAYIRTKPQEIKFSLPFSDNVEDRLIVRLTGKQTDVLIKDGSDEIMISVEDIEWLRQALDDVRQIVEMSNVEQNPERSVAT